MEIERILEKYKHLMLVIINQVGVTDWFLREDLLQEQRMHLVQLYRKGVFQKKFENIDDYIFICLKRRVINVLIQEKRSRYTSLNKKMLDSEFEYIDFLIEPINADNYQTILENIITYITSHLSVEEQALINLYFFKNKTLEEIGKSNNVSRETIRRSIKKIINEIRRWYR
ncbi:sigma-70 family RNA polymerase sigma factor [Paracholeplasma manati]|uniref:Sigma-70 family RNA polymerase sigma factor n=1 Tax=Paracholeplasma manati TaxID=591373 RepID=A0ABT2Y735_9MOLU|nr:sigma-70 family RNA polymerase sigma factor [Paracholeplasma manati]MCV2232552.1 sigma-70 family RNA polymerase sigma factor [Paracholeplasma manati]MDG0889045.1 sigma-70 family RNA polymerase sigma factor [Paracholeplasma manati]